MSGAATLNPSAMAEVLRRSLAIADRASVTHITSEAAPVVMPDGNWLDLRPLQDPARHTLLALGNVTELMAYAEQRGLIRRHPEHMHLVRVTSAATSVSSR